MLTILLLSIIYGRNYLVSGFTLKTSDSELIDRNGQEVEVVREIVNPEAGFDAEVLPMTLIRFADGTETAVLQDELVPAEQ